MNERKHNMTRDEIINKLLDTKPCHCGSNRDAMGDDDFTKLLSRVDAALNALPAVESPRCPS